MNNQARTPKWMDGIFAETNEQFPSAWVSEDGTKAFWSDACSMVWGAVDEGVETPLDVRLARRVEEFATQARTARGSLPREDLVAKLSAMPPDATVRVGPRFFIAARVLRFIERFDGDTVFIATASDGKVFPTLSLVVTCGDRGAFLGPATLDEGDPRPVTLIQPPSPRALQSEAEAKALKALNYLYEQARRRDPDLRFRIGGGTQVQYLCALALSELTGRPLEDVTAELSLPLVPQHHDPIPRSERDANELSIWRNRATDDDHAEVQAEVERWHEKRVSEYRRQQAKAGVL